MPPPLPKPLIMTVTKDIRNINNKLIVSIFRSHLIPYIILCLKFLKHVLNMSMLNMSFISIEDSSDGTYFTKILKNI